MIDGLARTLVLQGIGEVIAKLVIPLVPGPVVGLVLMLAFLTWRGEVLEGVVLVSAGFMRYLGVLFVPAGGGVMLFCPYLQRQALAIAVALVGSVVATVAVERTIGRSIQP